MHCTLFVGCAGGNNEEFMTNIKFANNTDMQVWRFRFRSAEISIGKL